MSSKEMHPTSSNKALSPFAQSYFPYKFLLHYSTYPPLPLPLPLPLPPPPPPPLPLHPTLLSLTPPGFPPVIHYPNMFIHANFSFIHHETIQRFPANYIPNSPSLSSRRRRFRRGRKCGGFPNDEARSPFSFDSGGCSSDGSGQMALTVTTTTGKYPRIVNSFRKDVEYGCRGGKGDRVRAKTVVPVSEGGDETTVMIRNIPNKYTRELLIDFLDDHCLRENQVKDDDEDDLFVSAYDFIYLPLDLRKKLNLGYAFVNFTDPRAVWRFYKAANRKKWQLFHSKKISEIASARLQGKEQLVVHFENTLFACESEDFLPVTFNPARDGKNAGSVVQATVGEIIATGPDHIYLPTIERRPMMSCKPMT